MCKMDDKRQNSLAVLGLRITGALYDIKKVRDASPGLKVKDTAALDKLEAAMWETAQYLVQELQAMEKEARE